MLRDKKVCGTKVGRIQRRLLAEPDLNLDKATKLALAFELADQKAAYVCSSSQTEGTVNKIALHYSQKEMP